MRTARRGVGSVVGGVALLLAVGVALALGSAPSGGGLIAFTVYSDRQTGIEVVSAAGGGLSELAVNTDNTPAWSPDGTQLAFAKNAGCSGCTEIYVMAADGSDQRRLTTAGTGANPAWSPTGNLIAFDGCASVTSKRCGIYSVAPNGSGLTQLGPLGPDYGPPVFSPNGSEIAFYSLEPSGIYVMAADGGDLHRLTKGNDSFPVWSPDGSQIAFTREIPLPGRNERDDIYVVNPDGTGLRRLTDSGRSNGDPAWAPNGQLIAFVHSRVTPAARCNSSAIYEMAPDGSLQTRITPFEPTYDDLTWSPDGNQLAFTSAHKCFQETQPLYVQYVTNGHPLLLAGNPGPEVGTPLAWQPAAAAP